jgi:hypothetical protein
VEKQLAEIVNRIRYQGRYTEVVGPASPLGRGKVFEVDAGKIEECVLIV